MHGQIPFLVLERLDGGTLTYLLNKPPNPYSKDNPFKILTALEIMKSLANAMKFLHTEFHPDAVLIHRDIKPDNIWYDRVQSTCTRNSYLCLA